LGERKRDALDRNGERQALRIRQHTSAYVSIRQHTSAYECEMCSTETESVRPCAAYVYLLAYVSIRQHTSAYVRPCAAYVYLAKGPEHSDLSIRQHTSAYVRIRQHMCTWPKDPSTVTSAYVSIRQHTSAYEYLAKGAEHSDLLFYLRKHVPLRQSIRQHTSAYVSIRQHTSAYVCVSILQHVPATQTTHARWPREICLVGALVPAKEHLYQHTSAYVSVCVRHKRHTRYGHERFAS
jgi:hypothetical protein